MSDDEAPEVLQSIGIGGEHAVWRYVGQDEWEPTTGLEELKRYYGGVQEG